MITTLIDRFTAKVEEPFDAHNDCWEWKGSRTKAGYGNIGIGKRNDYAHRVSYELFVEPIPEDCEIHHMCGNRGCVRPDHLEAIPRATHVHRGEGNAFQLNAVKTHCPKGHPYDEENTRIYQGRRWCKACDRIKTFKAYWRKKGGC